MQTEIAPCCMIWSLLSDTELFVMMALFLLIGIKILTMNIHQLRHLVYHVRNWGPLWSFSCFGFESLNGDLKVLFHGTRDMSEQVCSNRVFTVRMHFLINAKFWPYRWFSTSLQWMGFNLQVDCHPRVWNWWTSSLEKAKGNCYWVNLLLSFAW